MPEIGEIARTVHFLRKHLLNRTIASCQPFDDDIVYGKKGGTTAAAFSSAISGKKVTGAGQQGKYFYLTFNCPPHAVMHLGMTGWIKYSTEETGYYKQAVKKDPEEDWPPNPKWTKWLLKCEADGEREAVEVAFIDARRLGRIGLVDCAAEEIRNYSPLKENGPDPVVDKEKVTVEWLGELLGKKRVPVKALLLDQANISGVGNWVADEVLYQARIHPEQYSNTFGEEEIKRLHDALIEVCTIACETLADSTQFPDTWLMKYRWDKGKKDANVLPNGNKITHITVGGRTSAVVPAVQKKTGAVAGDVKEEDEEGKKKPAKGRKQKAKAEEDDDEDDEVIEKKPVKGRKRKAKTEDDEDEEEEEVMPAKKQRGKTVKAEDTPEEIEAAVPEKRGRAKKPKEEPVDANEGESEVQPKEDEPKPAKGKKAKATSKKTSKATPKKEVKAPIPGERKSARGKAK